MGAQAKGRAREALRPYGLFVSLPSGELSDFAHNSPQAREIPGRTSVPTDFFGAIRFSRLSAV